MEYFNKFLLSAGEKCRDGIKWKREFYVNNSSFDSMKNLHAYICSPKNDLMR